MPLLHAPTQTPAHAPTRTWIERRTDVEALAEQIHTDGIMALDTEFISERSYRPKLALVQVATTDGVYLIDPLVSDPDGPTDQPIWDAMADPSVRTIVHAHEQESRFCLQRTGNRPGDLFDVQLAAGLSGYHFPIAYDQLVRSALKRSMGPSQSRTNWTQRPLTDAQRQYAGDDVRWLIPLYDRFLSRWSRAEAFDPASWLSEELSGRLTRLGQGSVDPWRRVRGIGKLRPRALAVFRELHGWREQVAAERDVPIRRVAPDDTLLAIAAAHPTTAAELATVRGIERLRQTHRPDVLHAVQTALALPDAALPPALNRQRGPKRSPMLVSFLECVLAAACARCNVAPELVGGASQLRALITWYNDRQPDDQRPQLLQGWRREVCGDPLLQALNGKVRLRISDPSADNPIDIDSELHPGH